MSELAPLVNAQTGAFYVNEPIGDEPLAAADRQLRALASASRRKQSSARAKGWSASAPSRSGASWSPKCPPTTSQISSGTRATRPLIARSCCRCSSKATSKPSSSWRRSSTSAKPLALPRPAHRSRSASCSTRSPRSMRTEELLKQSQSLTAELQSQQMELQQTNDELEEKARLLQEHNAEVERRTREIEEARQELEQKAEQLALTSKYKSQFLANMSHELRTPLNSLLILSKQLADNPDETMSPKQVEFARTIRARRRRPADADQRHPRPLEDRVGHDVDRLRRTSRSLDSGRRRAHVRPDRARQEPRLHHPLATKICPKRCAPTRRACSRSSRTCSPTRSSSRPTAASRCDIKLLREHDLAATSAGPSVAFSVTDTGIGIRRDKHNVIFEAFQQADMGTARKFGGTGLGPRDQPRDRRPARRRDHGRERGRLRAARSRSTIRSSAIVAATTVQRTVARRRTACRSASCGRFRARWPTRAADASIDDDRERIDAVRPRRC